MQNEQEHTHEQKVNQFEQIVKEEFNKFAREKANRSKITLEHGTEKLLGWDEKVKYFDILKKKSPFHLFCKAQRVARIWYLSKLTYPDYNFEVKIYVSPGSDFLPYAESIQKQYKSKGIGNIEIIEINLNS